MEQKRAPASANASTSASVDTRGHKKTCADCRKQFVKRHTCRAGKCGLCRRHLMDIGRHICKVRTLQGFATDASATVAAANDESRFVCVGCRETHLVNKNVHSLRHWRGDLYCCDCYYGNREITRIRHQLGQALLEADFQGGRHRCGICDKSLVRVDPDSVDDRGRATYRKCANIERDHVDVMQKRECVGVMVSRGCPEDEILREAARCRNLCVRCHSIVTFVERRSGILSIRNDKEICVSPSLIDRVRQQVEACVEQIARSSGCRAL